MKLPDPQATAEVSVREVSAFLALPANERPRVVDCREAEEREICLIGGTEHVPLGEFPARRETLSDAPNGIVIFCHHGMRSLRAVDFLRAHGVENAFSMAGGIDAWSREIDGNVPRY